MSDRALRVITNSANGGKAPDLRTKTLRKVMRRKQEGLSENGDEKQRAQWLMAVERAAWRRGLTYSSSSTSSCTSEEDDVTKKEMFSRIRARLNQFDSDSDCTTSEDDTMIYGGGPGIRMRKMRRLHQMRRQMSTTDVETAASTQGEDEVFSAHLQTALSVRSLPQSGARDRLEEIGVVPEHSQLKLVVCGSSKKLTVTFLGLKSFTQVCKTSGLPNNIYLKLSLSPDTDSRIRHKTKPERVTDDVTSLHDTFTFDISHREANKRLLISAWSKLGDEQRSSFIGCMSFGVRNMINNQEVIQGWYYFLRENLGRRKHLKVKSHPSMEAKRRRTPRRHHITVRSRDSESCGSRSGNPSRSRSVRRRSSTRSGSSDSSLASGYAKTCVYDRCSCNCCVIDEEDRQRRRLSKLNKRRRVSVGVSTPGVVYFDLHERMPDDGESPVVTSSVTRRDVTRAVEKRSCEVVSGAMQKMGTKTPCGRRNLQRKNYSSDDLLLSRISYCADPDQAKDEEDDDVFVSGEELKEASLHRMETRSARIVSPSSLVTSAKQSSSKLDEFAKPSDSVSKLRNLRVHNVQPIKFDFEPEAQPPSPGADDRGYHSDTGLSTSSTTSEESSSSQQSSGESDYVCMSSGDASGASSHSEGCSIVDDLIKSCDAIADDVICRDASAEEKTKAGKFFSIKTWLHRKAGDLDHQHRPAVSLKTSQSQRRTEAEANKLRRTASLRKPKRNACENCFGNVMNLSELLDKKGGVTAFRTFLQREFSEENIDFWVDVQNYKLAKPSKARKMALKIFERYVATGSPNEINVDGHIREETKRKLNDGSGDVFDAAQFRIFKLMERDSFRRFLVSDLAHRCKA